MAGNPNPSPETRFQPGNPGGGKTSEQKRLEYEAAEMAARIRHKALSVIAERIDAGLSPIEGMTPADILRLMKDSEDRAHGTPKATTEMTGANGGPVAVVRYEVIDPPARE
jgi:hypothetical protein